MILKGEISQYGSFAPEGVVPCRKFFEALNKNSMTILKNGEKVNPEEIENEIEIPSVPNRRGDQYI